MTGLSQAHPVHSVAILAGLVAMVGCKPTPPQNPAGKQAATSAPASEERLAAMEKRLADLDGRLAAIENLIQGATDERPEPDPDEVYAVPIDGLPFIGPAHAKVTVVKAYEFACGFCAQSAPIMRQLLADYKGDVKVVYAPFIVHADVAIPSAMAVCAAHNQSKFAEMEALVWKKGWDERDLSLNRMDALAQEVGLDMARYRRDVTSEPCMDSLRNSARTLSALGTSGTPTFFINGRYLVGAQPIEAFKELIDEELAKANRAIASGVKVEDYYRTAVMDAGKKAP